MHLRIVSKGKWLLLISVVVTFAVLAGWLFLETGKDTPTEAVNTGAVTYSTDTPDETKPEEDYDWNGTADDPKKIIIPSLSVDGFIQNVGVDQNQEIAVPSNIHMAGWFVDSARPGGKGLSIIDGHLNGYRESGIFADLEKIEVGATFTIEFGSGDRLMFRVRNVQTVYLDDAASVLFSQDPSVTHQLNLITCGGDFDRESNLYEKRVVVTSGLIGS